MAPVGLMSQAKPPEGAVKPIILLDVDGVLADFIGHLIAQCESSGTPMPPREDWTFYWDTCLTHEQRSAAYRLLDDQLLRPSTGAEFCRTLPVIEGAQEAVAFLSQIGKVYIVTATWRACAGWEKARRDWLKEHFGIHPRDVISTSEKHLVRGDLFIDDKPNQVSAWSEANPFGAARLFHRPHNRGAPFTMQRVHDWRRGSLEALSLAASASHFRRETDR